MSHRFLSICFAIAAGIASVLFLPPHWLAPLSASAAICCALFALIVRLATKTEPPTNPLASIFFSVANILEQPLAKVREGKALTVFLVSAAFLVSIGFTVIVLTNA